MCGVDECYSSESLLHLLDIVIKRLFMKMFRIIMSENINIISCALISNPE